MKKVILLFLIQIFCSTAGFTQNPPWKQNGVLISARANLDVRWEDQGDAFPQNVWIYKFLPNDFSPEVVSNILTLCSLSEKDLVGHHPNGMDFQSADGSRKLSIFFPTGSVHYDIPEAHYNPTNLAIGVPLMDQLPELATNVLRKLNISFSDITGYLNTNNIEYSEPVLTVYYMKGIAITNIAYRSVLFRRVVDGMPIVGNFYGFNVGEHGKISKLSIAWPNLQRVKSYPTASKLTMINFLRNGNAVRGPVPDNVPDIDWPSVKSVIVKKATPCYQVENNRLYPFLHLDVLIDTGSMPVEIGMECPIIDEAK